MSKLYHYPYIKDLQILAKKNKKQVYLVGGFLRDYIVGTFKNDYDFAVNKGAIALAKKFADQIKGAFILLDEEHGCARVAKKIKGELFTFDFADYRGKTIEDDLKLRDYTINTLCVHLNKLTEKSTIDNSLIDYKRALKDIEAKRIKRTSVRSIKDDPLRIMRAFSLKSSLGFRIELPTLNQLKKERNTLQDVSMERVRDELFKILESKRCAQTFKEMDKAGILDQVIPQLKVMYDCHQGGYHHLDVWPHSLETVRQLEKLFEECSDDAELQEYINADIGANHKRYALMKLGALLHDIGKPDTKRIEKGKMSFHGHEHVGRKITKNIAKMLKVSTKERYILENMVQWHLRPGYLSNFKNPSAKALFRYFRDTADEAVNVALFSIADQRSTRGPLTLESDQKHHYNICTMVIEKYFEKQKEEPVVALINGNDLIKKFKLKPSPIFKTILEEVAEQQSLEKIKNKTEALKLAKEMIEKIKVRHENKRY